MSVKEFTLQKGLRLPILKVLNELGGHGTPKAIFEYITRENLFNPCDGDLEKIDVNNITRLENAIGFALTILKNEGLISVSDGLYSITSTGKNYLVSEWSSYSHDAFVKTIEVDNSNKFTYSGIPPYLLYNGHRQLSVSGLVGHDDEYVKFLNDFIDYVDLNYPTVEEMFDFLKSNYDFSDDDECLNCINILRTSGLAKMIGKNLSLTKLGQWYINSYNNIVLFKIFANRFAGFEEMFNTIALRKEISLNELSEDLLKDHSHEWASGNQFTERYKWMLAFEIIESDNGGLALSGEALELAEFFGLLDIEGEVVKKAKKVIIPSISEITDTDEIFKNVMDDVNEESFSFSNEIDNIIDDLISENGDNNKKVNVSHENVENSITEDINDGLNPNEGSNKEGISLTDAYEEIDEFITLSSNNSKEAEEDNESVIEEVDEETELIIEEIDEVPSSVASIEDDAKTPLENNRVVIQIPTQVKTKDNTTVLLESYQKQNISSKMYIHPDEIAKLVNLPKDTSVKIASALNMGKHLILTGPHGSGKTSVAVILARIAQQKAHNSGYNLITANNSWTTEDTIGNLIEPKQGFKKIFKEGAFLKSVRENKWLIVDNINNCNVPLCFDELINALYGYNTILPYIHENYKNIEILSDSAQRELEVNQYHKNKDWRMIATLDTSERNSTNFSPEFIRRFAFIDLGLNSYSKVIDEYFERYELQNDLLKSKVKSMFSDNGLLKFKDFGTSTICDLIEYMSLRVDLMDDDTNMQDILAEGLELYVLPQLRTLDAKSIKEVQSYLLDIFDGYSEIKKYVSNAF